MALTLNDNLNNETGTGGTATSSPYGTATISLSGASTFPSNILWGRLIIDSLNQANTATIALIAVQHNITTTNATVLSKEVSLVQWLLNTENGTVAYTTNGQTVYVTFSVLIDSVSTSGYRVTTTGNHVITFSAYITWKDSNGRSYAITVADTITLATTSPVLDSIFASSTGWSQTIGETVTVPSDFKVYSKLTSNDGSYVETPEITAYTISSTGISSDMVGKTTMLLAWKTGLVCLVNYESKTVSITLTALGIKSLTVENATTGFTAGDAWTKGDSFKATVNYDDGTSAVVTSDVVITCAYAEGDIIPDDATNFTYTVAYTASFGESVESTISVSVTAKPVVAAPTLSSIAITTKPTKTSYNYGENFSKSGMVVTATYSDSSTAVISDYTISIADGTKIEQTTTLKVTVTYGSKTATFNCVITYLSSISLSGTYPTTFYDGDNFDSTGLIVTANYSKSDGSTGSSATTTDYELDKSSTNILRSSSGDTTIDIKATLTVNGITKSKSYSITVTAIEVTSITLDTTALSSSVEGELKFYQAHTPLNISKFSGKLIVTAHRNNDTTATVNLSDCEFSPAANSLFNTLSSTAAQSVTVTYSGQSASFTVNVIEHVISSITVDATNATTSFSIGSTFSYSGIVVKAFYNTGDTSDYDTITDGVGGYTLSVLGGYVIRESDYGVLTTETVSYGGLTASYSITITYPSIKSITLDSSALDLQPKNGDTWDPSILGVTANYDSGFTKALTRVTTLANLASGNFFIDVSSLNLTTENVISQSNCIEYSLLVTGMSAFSTDKVTSTLYVSILPNATLRRIELITTNAKTQYKTGETFAGTGFKIRAYFSDIATPTDINVDGNDSSVTTSNPALGDTFYKAGTYEVTFNYTKGNVTLSAKFAITVVPSYETSNTFTKQLKIVKVASLSKAEVSSIQKNSDGKVWALYDYNDTTLDDDGNRIIKSNVTNAVCYGYVIQGQESEGVTMEPAKVVLFDDYVPPVDGQSNIKVVFPRLISGASDKINHCTFGALFGNNNSKNRLFVSGNSDYGMSNLDWHSSDLDTNQLDANEAEMANYMLTYFPDTSYQQYGLSSNAIIGYTILSTGDLFVLKAPSKQEPTFYARSAGTMDAITGTGSTATGIDGSTLQMEVYTISTGNIDDGGLSAFSMASFNNESLFLSPNGLKAISPSTSIASIKTSARSQFIDRKLKGEISNSTVLFSNDDYLYLFTGADAFVTNKECVNSDGNYEWWYFDNIPAICAKSINNEIWFGTNDGALCLFDDGEPNDKTYSDKARVYIGTGGILPVSDSTNVVTISSAYKGRIANGDSISVLNSNNGAGIYCNLGFFARQSVINNMGYAATSYQGLIDEATNTFIVKAVGEDKLNSLGESVPLQVYEETLFSNGRKVYIDQITCPLNTTANTNGVHYTVEQTDDMDIGTFKLVKDDGTYADLSKLESCRISFVPDENAIVSSLDESGTNVTFKLKDGFENELDIIQYEGQSMSGFKAIITHSSTVNCHFITKPFNMGSNSYKKNILSWTLVNDSQLKSQMDIKYAVNNYQKDYISASDGSGSMELDLENFTLKSVSTFADTLPHVYTRWKNAYNIDNISFELGNSSEANCVLTNISLLYTGGEARKGAE